MWQMVQKYGIDMVDSCRSGGLETDRQTYAHRGGGGVMELKNINDILHHGVQFQKCYFLSHGARMPLRR